MEFGGVKVCQSGLPFGNGNKTPLMVFLSLKINPGRNYMPVSNMPTKL